MFNIYKVLAIIMLIMAASACSSSEDSDTGTSYFRFYNASLNAGVHEIFLSPTDEIEEDPFSIGRIDFADASSIVAVEVDTYDLTIMRDDSNNVDEQLTVLSSQVNLDESNISVNIMVGDAEQPELIEFKYDITSIDDLDIDDEQFEIYFANLLTDSAQLDIYMSTEEETFADAQLISSLQYKEFSTMQIMGQDTYIIYITNAGSTDVIFESKPIALTFMQTFILTIRDDAGVRGMAIDRLTDSTVVYSYVDELTEAEIRFYKSNNTTDNIDVYLGTTFDEPFIRNLSSGLLTDNIVIENDTYTLTTTVTDQVENINLRNLVLSLEEDDSKIVLLYPDSNNEHQGLIFDQQTRILAYENQIRVINIGEIDQDIDIYFIKNDETISTAEDSLRSIDYSETNDITILTQEFRIFVTAEDDNDNLRSLFESQSMTLEVNKNYLMILERDDETFSGYNLVIIEE